MSRWAAEDRLQSTAIPALLAHLRLLVLEQWVLMHPTSGLSKQWFTQHPAAGWHQKKEQWHLEQKRGQEGKYMQRSGLGSDLFSSCLWSDYFSGLDWGLINLGGLF